jgi:TPR repeat protein
MGHCEIGRQHMMGLVVEVNEVTQQMVQEWFEAAERGEAQAAYRLAEFGLKRRAKGDCAAAEGWLRRAAELGGVPMLWQVAHLTADWTELGGGWQREAIATEWGGSGVAVDENTFELYQAGGDG